jgi:bacillopeptidase F (M6 metalloprotease family)
MKIPFPLKFVKIIKTNKDAYIRYLSSKDFSFKNIISKNTKSITGEKPTNQSINL